MWGFIDKLWLVWAKPEYQSMKKAIFVSLLAILFLSSCYVRKKEPYYHKHQHHYYHRVY